MSIRSVTYKTMTNANANYAVSDDTRMGRVTILNDSGGTASNANTARVFVGGSADAVTDKFPLALNASKEMGSVNPSTIYGRSATAGQILTVIIED